MSCYFWAEPQTAPTYQAVLEGIETDDLSSIDDELEDGDGPWVDGHTVYIWRDGISTRPISLTWEDGQFSARILAASCREDYRLAVDAVCTVASEAGVDVESEDGGRFAPEDREVNYGDAWIDDHVRTMVMMMLAKTEGDSEPPMSHLSGPTRTFYLGPRTRARLDGLDAADRQAALFEAMRTVFYPDENEVFAANVMVRDLPDGTHMTGTAWGPGVTYHFPTVDELMLFNDPPVFFPFAKLETLVGSDGLRWIDDATVRIKAVPQAQWEAFVERAIAIAGGYNMDSAESDVPIPAMDTILPVLQRPDWKMTQTMATRPLLNVEVAGGLNVSFVSTAEDSKGYLPAKSLAAMGKTFAQVEERALENLRARLGESQWEEFEVDESNRLLFLRGGVLNASRILLPEVIKAAHDRLGSELLHVAAPDRNTIIAAEDPTVAIGIAERQFEKEIESQGSPLSSSVFLFSNGEPVALAKGCLADPSDMAPTGGHLTDIHLIRGPIAVFVSVALADGSIDNKELRAFRKFMGERIKTASPMLQGLLFRCMKNIQSLIDSVIEDSPLVALPMLASSVKKHLPPEVATEYR